MLNWFPLATFYMTDRTTVDWSKKSKFGSSIKLLRINFAGPASWFVEPQTKDLLTYVPLTTTSWIHWYILQLHSPFDRVQVSRKSYARIHDMNIDEYPPLSTNFINIHHCYVVHSNLTGVIFPVKASFFRLKTQAQGSGDIKFWTWEWTVFTSSSCR